MDFDLISHNLADKEICQLSYFQKGSKIRNGYQNI